MDCYATPLQLWKAQDFTILIVETFGVIHLGEKKLLFWAPLLPILGVFTANICLWN